MNEIASKEQKQAASRLRNLLSLYEDNFDLISIGAYKKGSNKALDEAIMKIDRINGFLTQEIDDSFEFGDTVKMLKEAVG